MTLGTEIMSKRVSMLDLLAKYPTVKLPIATFLEISTPMRVRQYSISSSANYLGEGKCSLTVAVLVGPAKSGTGVHKGMYMLDNANTKVGLQLSFSIGLWPKGCCKYL